MLERNSTRFKILLISGLILAALIALTRLEPITITRDRPTPRPWIVEEPAATAQPTSPLAEALPTQPLPTVAAALPPPPASPVEPTATAATPRSPLLASPLQPAPTGVLYLPGLPASPLQPVPTSMTNLSSPLASPVPEPTPTEKPRPTLPAPPLNGSKLSVHGIWASRIIEFTGALAEAGTPFRVVKAVDDLSWLKSVRRISPETVTVARMTHEHEGAQLVNDPNEDLDRYAAVLMEPILTKLEAEPTLREAVTYWEVTNEPLGGGVPTEVYTRLAQLTIKCLDIGEANGLKLAIFGFSAGTPEWADLEAIVATGVFARAKAGGHILTLHEGVFGDEPIDKWWNAHAADQDGNPTAEETGVATPGGWIPGAPVVEGAGALTLRYRFLYRLLEERDEAVPLFVSEFYAGGGYDPVDKPDVVARMHWYDMQVSTDEYVLGFAPFTLGPVPQWVGQDYGPFYEGEDGLVAYMTAKAKE